MCKVSEAYVMTEWTRMKKYDNDAPESAPEWAENQVTGCRDA